MKIKLEEAAKIVDGNIVGDKNITISSFAKIEEAQPGDLTFLYLDSYKKFFPSTKASAILVKPDFPKSRNDITYIEVESPNKAFSKLLNHYFKHDYKLSGIDPSAFIHSEAMVGENTAIGKNVVVSSGCKIGSNVKIFHNAVLLENVEVGDNSVIFQNVSIREECRIGKNVIIHANSVIGSDGFGYDIDENKIFHKIPQIGIVIIEDDVEIGSNVSIDRASLGATIIKKGVKIDNLVQIAHNVVIGENSIIAGQAGVAGSSKIGKHCYLLGQVGVSGHLEVTDNVILHPQAGISKSITKPGNYFGSPAKEIKDAFKLEAHYRNLPDYVERIKQLEKLVKELQEKLGNK
ncbi:MAG: UDP-3-O-(3-hydroxymyristoyl)glucosamine N-acyltransferase [Ignavibacteria bacterium]|nr:UDP-3-O-(3-hydroxymyristoyl)glucosamine N-acyltransferase [Ignavibacteria bacterium]